MGIINSVLDSIKEFPKNALSQVFTHDDVAQMLKCDASIDLIIPRGGNKLVKFIKENTKIPVLGHADGICHIFTDESADFETAKKVIIDAKTQYPSACNAVETLLIHKNFNKKDELLKELENAEITLVSNPDTWAFEHGDKTLAYKVVTNIDEARKSDSVNRYLIDQDGNFYRYHASVFGEMVVKTSEIPATIVDEYFEWQLPKIPSELFGQIIGFFKHFAENDKRPLEVALRVYWDSEQKQFVLECPKQIVSPVRIELEYGEQFTGRNSLRYIPVLEIHSHNVMRAFFSEVDDADEQAFCVYGVLGRLDREKIEMCFRAKCGDNFINLAADVIFDLTSNPPSFDFPSEWLENVTVSKGWFK